MGIIFVLIIFSALIAIVFLVAFIISVRAGQFDDTETPARRILFDDFKPTEKDNTNKDLKGK